MVRWNGTASVYLQVRVRDMRAESVNHNCVSDLLPDFCGMIVERDSKLVQSDLSGLLDLSFIGCCLCILPAGGGCFGTGNMALIGADGSDLCLRVVPTHWGGGGSVACRGVG